MHQFGEQPPLRPRERLVVYDFQWALQGQYTPDQLSDTDEFRQLFRELTAMNELRWAYRYTEYDSIEPIHSFIASGHTDQIERFCHDVSLGNHYTISHVDDSFGKVATWARGQYKGMGVGFAIGNWQFAINLFNAFTEVRLERRETLTLDEAMRAAGLRRGEKYWWSFLTFCIFSRCVHREEVELSPTMYTMGTRLDCIPPEERERAVRLLGSWRAPPVQRQRLPRLPQVNV
jgi:hypothetical protein